MTHGPSDTRGQIRRREGQVGGGNMASRERGWWEALGQGARKALQRKLYSGESEGGKAAGRFFQAEDLSAGVAVCAYDRNAAAAGILGCQIKF